MLYNNLRQKAWTWNRASRIKRALEWKGRTWHNFKGKKLTVAHRHKLSLAKIGHNDYLTPAQRKRTNAKISKALTGKKLDPIRVEKMRKRMLKLWKLGKASGFKKGYAPSEAVRKKLSLIRKGQKWPEEHKKRLSLMLSGARSPSWKGGVTPIYNRIRRSYPYKRWTRLCKERDGYKCCKCGIKNNLEVDHIKPFALYPKLRLVVSNGRTLCVACHQRTKTYGWNIYHAKLAKQYRQELTKQIL